jgi:hypothetical protein
MWTPPSPFDPTPGRCSCLLEVFAGEEVECQLSAPLPKGPHDDQHVIIADARHRRTVVVPPRRGPLLSRRLGREFVLGDRCGAQPSVTNPWRAPLSSYARYSTS